MVVTLVEATVVLTEVVTLTCVATEGGVTPPVVMLVETVTASEEVVVLTPLPTSRIVTLREAAVGLAGVVLVSPAVAGATDLSTISFKVVVTSEVAIVSVGTATSGCTLTVVALVVLAETDVSSAAGVTLKRGVVKASAATDGNVLENIAVFASEIAAMLLKEMVEAAAGVVGEIAIDRLTAVVPPTSVLPVGEGPINPPWRSIPSVSSSD